MFIVQINGLHFDMSHRHVSFIGHVHSPLFPFPLSLSYLFPVFFLVPPSPSSIFRSYFCHLVSAYENMILVGLVSINMMSSPTLTQVIKFLPIKISSLLAKIFSWLTTGLWKARIMSAH
jgi:hypothetical protein